MELIEKEAEALRKEIIKLAESRGMRLNMLIFSGMKGEKGFISEISTIPVNDMVVYFERFKLRLLTSPKPKDEPESGSARFVT